MKRFLTALSLAGLFCLASGAQAHEEFSTPKPTPSFKGVWTPKTTAESGPQVIAGCYPVYETWKFEKKGGKVKATIKMYNPNYDPSKPRKFTLDFDPELNLLKGFDPYPYERQRRQIELRWDDKNGHWVGTSGGLPLRLAPMLRVEPEAPCAKSPHQ
jgi:hypothetical protein